MVAKIRFSVHVEDRTEITATVKNISLDIFNSDGHKTQSLVLDVE